MISFSTIFYLVLYRVGLPWYGSSITRLGSRIHQCELTPGIFIDNELLFLFRLRQTYKSNCVAISILNLKITKYPGNTHWNPRVLVNINNVTTITFHFYCVGRIGELKKWTISCYSLYNLFCCFPIRSSVLHRGRVNTLFIKFSLGKVKDGYFRSSSL